jgi:hypothetical protein
MSRCWSVQQWLTWRWKGRPQHQKRTSLRTARQNDEPQSQPRADYPPYCEPLACYHFTGPGLQGPNGLKTLEPRGR